MKNPKKVKQVKLTETQQCIASQLSENTGSALCDSGDFYGRNYEKYSGGVDFTESLRVDKFGAIIPIQIWMNHNLDRNKSAILLEKTLLNKLREEKVEYVELCYRNESEILDALKSIEATETCYGGLKFDNTYNGDNNLSQNLQLMIFEFENKEYAIIETHNGCDIRGGYSTGKLYQINDMDDFMEICLRCNTEDDDDINMYDDKVEFDEGKNTFVDKKTRKEILMWNPCL